MLGREIASLPGSAHSGHEQNVAWASGLGLCRHTEEAVDRFIYDEVSGGFYYNSVKPNNSLNWTSDKGLRLWSDIDVTMGRIVALAYSPVPRYLLTVSLRMNDSLLTMLPDPGFVGQSDDGSDTEAPYHLWARTLSPDETIYAAAANPEATDELLFTVATSSGPQIIGTCTRGTDMYLSGSNGLTALHRSEVETEESSDTLSVDWLDRNVVVSGRRNGAVRLWDIRSRGLDACSAPIQHPSCISHIRSLDRNRIVVAGLQDQVCFGDHSDAILSKSPFPHSIPMRSRLLSSVVSLNDWQLSTYDLRFSRIQQEGRRNSRRYRPITEPWQTYPTYRNRFQPGWEFGFAVHPRSASLSVQSQLIAAASDRPSTPPSSWASLRSEHIRHFPGTHYVDRGDSVQVLSVATGLPLSIGRSGKGAEREDREEDMTSGDQANVQSVQSEYYTQGLEEDEEKDWEELSTTVTCCQFVERDSGVLSIVTAGRSGLEEWCW